MICRSCFLPACPPVTSPCATAHTEVVCIAMSLAVARAILKRSAFFGSSGIALATPDPETVAIMQRIAVDVQQRRET